MLIEHRTFRLAEDVTDEQFLAADERVQQEVAPFQTGFVRRTTARGSDGRWLVETMWWDLDHCEAGSDASLGDFTACVDPTSLEVARWETLD